MTEELLLRGHLRRVPLGVGSGTGLPLCCHGRLDSTLTFMMPFHNVIGSLAQLYESWGFGQKAQRLTGSQQAERVRGLRRDGAGHGGAGAGAAPGRPVRQDEQTEAAPLVLWGQRAHQPASPSRSQPSCHVVIQPSSQPFSYSAIHASGRPAIQPSSRPSIQSSSEPTSQPARPGRLELFGQYKAVKPSSQASQARQAARQPG